MQARGFKVRTLDSQPEIQGAEPLPEAGWSEGLDLIVVVGGDGTLLRASQIIGENKVPVLGVKLGGLGFLTEIRPEEFPAVLDDVMKGDVHVMDRMMIEGRITGSEGRFKVLNEVTIASSGPPRIIELDTNINGVFVTSFRADGLLVSTPTGSTAYCMAAGGPIVHPAMSCMVITPICPHTLTSRPLVIPDSAVVSISAGSVTSPVSVHADSQTSWTLEKGQRVEMKAAQRGLSLVCSPSMNYYEILRTKLRWGER